MNPAPRTHLPHPNKPGRTRCGYPTNTRFAAGDIAATCTRCVKFANPETFPYEPLATAARASSVAELAAATGTSKRNVLRWKKHDAIPERSADRAAIAIGLHPVCVWPDYY